MRHSEFLTWDRYDRDKAIWRRIRVRQTCPHCGTRAEEWDPQAGGHRHAYGGHKAFCRGCEVKEQAEAALQGEADRVRGTYIELRRRPRRGR